MALSFPLRASVGAGGWVALSGHMGEVDGVLVDGGVAAQTRRALENFVGSLAANGLTAADVVKTTVFLVTMDDFAAMNEEYAKVFHTDPPARSTVAVHQLWSDGVVEIEGWACRAAGRQS
jgi:2-iminobutanoate/2-iminopropanoate deaminase